MSRSLPRSRITVAISYGCIGRSTTVASTARPSRVRTFRAIPPPYSYTSIRSRVVLAHEEPPARRTGGGSPPLSAAQHAAQDVLHDPAVAVVVRLAGGVDAHGRLELDLLAG